MSYETLEGAFCTAISKRCVTDKSRVKAAGFFSAFVMFDTSRHAPFTGEGALFALAEFHTLLAKRGPSVPGVARWPFGVCGGILDLIFHL